MAHAVTPGSSGSLPRVVRRSRAHGATLVALGTLVAGAVALLPAHAIAQGATAQGATAGLYTEEQAARGEGVFARSCVECHTRKDMTNADFRMNWNGRTVFALFDRIRTTMPEAAPGSLTPDEYAAVTSYMLKLNGLPAGPAAMPADSSLLARTLPLDGPPPPSTASRPLRGHDVSRTLRVGSHARPVAPRRTGAGSAVRPSAGHPRGR